MATLSAPLRRIKDDLARIVPSRVIEDCCEKVGHRWRTRLLDPATTVYLFILQILQGNTACNEVRHIGGRAFSASAYCKARMRLPLALFKMLALKVTGTLRRTSDSDGRWLGHRVFHVDGTTFSMSDTQELQNRFGQPGGQKAGCGFPVAHALALCEAATGYVVDVIVSPLRTHDMAHVAKLHPRLVAGDVLVGDRAFCSFAHMALLSLGQVHGILRVHQRHIVSFKKNRLHKIKKRDAKGLPTSRYVRSLGDRDQIVEWRKPSSCPKWMGEEQYASLPTTLLMRELAYRIRRSGFRTEEIVLATTLLDAEKYPISELAEQYLRRWAIEVNFGHLKTTMKMDVLRCKTPDGVEKEMWMYVLVYNLIRSVMWASSEDRGIPPDRISFQDALRSLRWPPGEGCVSQLVVNPHRPDRIEPRATKRRPKAYPRLTVPRREARKRLSGQGFAA